jgi:hypothetical protein
VHLALADDAQIAYGVLCCCLPAPVQAAQIPLQAPAGWTSTNPDAVRISPQGDAVAAVSGEETGGTVGEAIWRFDGSLAYSSFVPNYGLPFFSPSGDRVLLADQVVDVASASLDFLLSDQAVLLASDTSSALDSTGRRLARWADDREGRVELLLYDARFSIDGAEQVLSGDGYAALSTSTEDILFSGRGHPGGPGCIVTAAAAVHTRALLRGRR